MCVCDEVCVCESVCVCVCVREIVREYECIVVVANGVYVVCTMCCAVGFTIVSHWIACFRSS